MVTTPRDGATHPSTRSYLSPLRADCYRTQHQVHADASTFKPNVTKEDAYTQVLEQATALFEDQRNWVERYSPVKREDATSGGLTGA